ncbi:hypothetical protein Gotur_012073 [Gossypium turneri]
MINEQESNWWDQGSPALAFIGLLVYTGSYIVGSGIPWLLLSEVILALFIFVIIFHKRLDLTNDCISIGIVSGTFFIFSACCAANFILSATMVPETKRRTLEEIQASITQSLD